MYFKTLPLFVAAVWGLAAPVPTPEAALEERQVASGTICASIGPISGCIDPDGATIANPDATASATFGSGTASVTLEGSSLTAGGTIGSDGASATLEGSSITVGVDATATSSASTTLVVVTSDAEASGSAGATTVSVATDATGNAGVRQTAAAALAGVGLLVGFL